MKAIILAAGFGHRLRPLTDTIPKPLLPLEEKPLISHTINLLKRHGFLNIVINLHHLGDKIESCLGDGSHLGVRIHYSREDVILGTGGGIRRARPLLEGGPFLVINGDILVDINLRELFEFHQKIGGAATMVLRDDPLKEGYGAVKVDENGRVRDILGRVKAKGKLKKMLFTGIQILEEDIFDCIPETFPSSLTEDAYPELILRGKTVYMWEHRGYFIDMGTHAGYKQAIKDVSQGKINLLLKEKSP